MNLRTVKKINHLPMAFGCAAIFLLGLIFLYLTFAVIIPNSKDNGVEVQATIENIVEHQNKSVTGEIENSDYEVFLVYDYEGTTYHSVTGNYDSSMEKGNVITIHINPNNPEEILSDGSFTLIFGILSGIFTIVGLFGSVYNIKKLVDMKKKEEA